MTEEQLVQTALQSISKPPSLAGNLSADQRAAIAATMLGDLCGPETAEVTKQAVRDCYETMKATDADLD